MVVYVVMRERESVGIAATVYLANVLRLRPSRHALVVYGSCCKQGILSGGPSAMKPDKALYEAKISMSEYLLAESCATLARVQW